VLGLNAAIPMKVAARVVYVALASWLATACAETVVVERIVGQIAFASNRDGDADI